MKKNILIITQTVDEQDSNLGFFCGWLKEFSKQLDQVYVIANKVGEYDLPNNITVLSLGKEEGMGKFGKIINFWKYLFKYLPKVDAVFAHMCPEYIISGGWITRLYGKKIGLWYLHKSKTLKLVLANILANRIFTAHSDGYPIKSNKVVVTGHGIDLSLFVKKHEEPDNADFTLLTVGRLSASKNLLILAKSAIILKQKLSESVKLIIVGDAYLDDDKIYLEEIKKYIKENNAEDIFQFTGSVRHEKTIEYYNKADLFLNASRTGGVDKAVLEAMASGLPVITSNFAFKNILPENCVFEDDSIDDLVEKILNYRDINVTSLRDAVLKNHSLENTIEQIISNLIMI
ncbi:MAG: glycosyltransferase family 4 protein [bacterium]|nr:glycosyltransferase family 4 protein [bacterium]